MLNDKLLNNLKAARNVLAGCDVNGNKIHPGIFDQDVISLSSGNGMRRPHFDVVKKGIRALINDEVTCFDSYHFLKKFEQLELAIKETFLRFGVFEEHCKQICIDAGLTRLFNTFLTIYANPGDIFLTPKAFYHPLPLWCELAKVRLEVVETKVENGYKITAEAIELWMKDNKNKLNLNKVKGLFLFNPNYIGAIYNKEEIKNLAITVEKYNLFVLEDAIFKNTEFPDSNETTLLGSIPEMKDRILVAHGGSKLLNIANLRIGWACGSESVIRKMNEYISTTLISLPYFIRYIAYEALTSKREYFIENSNECCERVKLIKKICDLINLQAYKFDVSHLINIDFYPQSGHSLLLDFEGISKVLGVDNSIALVRWFLENSKIGFAPGITHGFNGPKLRISYASIGQYKTYPSAINQELAAVIDDLTQLASKRGLISYAFQKEIITSFDLPNYINGFYAGRNLLKTALHDRFLAGIQQILKGKGKVYENSFA